MRTLFKIAFLVTISASLTSCFDKSKPNYQYFPNMYESASYETYGAYSIFPDEQSAMMPAENTVPRGWQPYEYEDSNEGLLKAKAELTNPYEVNESNLAVGRNLFTLYCAVCHGDKGDGQGILVQREKFLGIPSFADPGRTIVPGGIYHVQTYGLNAMGSYTSQTSEKERWQIAMHVMDLKASLLGEPGVLETAANMASEENVETGTPETTEAGSTGEVQPN